MKASLVLSVLMLVLAAAAPQAQEAPTDAGLSPEGVKKIGAWFRQEVAKGAIPGAVVLVARHDKVALLEAYGDATIESRFRIASMTKPITAVAALMLVEEGRLSLDDPVARYIPAFAETKVFKIRENADGTEEAGQEPQVRPMTILDLLRHTSGLTSPEMGFDPVQRSYVTMKLLDNDQTNEEMANKLARLWLHYQPGTRWEYSMSFDLLGRIIEIVSGKSLDTFVAERITAPLKMTRTGFTATTWKSGGAGMVSTAADYARFLRMLSNGGELDGVRLLSSTSVGRMTRNQLPAGMLTGDGTGYGFGVGVRANGTYFWSGALGTYFWVDPEAELFAVLMLQSQTEKERCREALLEMVYRSLAK